MVSRFAGGAASLVLLAFSVPATADEVKLPPNIAWTAYDSTSSGYAQSIGLGNMLKGKYDTELRVIPGKNDVSRMLPLKAKQVDICACGIADYFAQEGVYMFADPSWGPQPIMSLFNNIGRNGTGLAIAGDAGVKKVEDLKGKRVTWVRGSPALNVNAAAALAFAGLTWDDVEKIEVPGFGQSVQAVIDGQADAVYGSTITSAYAQLQASPRGIYHTVFPHDDKEGWKRIHAVAPYWQPGMVSASVGGENNITGKMPYEGAKYPYPTFIAYPRLSDEIAYGLTKAVMENYEVFKESGPGMDGYQLSNQNLHWIFPYHPGAIRYYKEAGVWTDDDQANTDAILERQKILMDAWKTATADGFDEKKWKAARVEALGSAGLDAPFTD